MFCSDFFDTFEDAFKNRRIDVVPESSTQLWIRTLTFDLVGEIGF
ncbi:hypothetical protein [Halohasta litorea]|uniref:Uncharacterized protein n=1 Tax=Halohasta litorea TaxID=869891 RepID=A0ABD6DB91_9EURY|nr:hypothetical protein [Halohasta litorea]